ncbi:MAG: hypothetical protein LBK05_01315, partial [Treponema sp.]|nr:hypothetical protein [Treponema sp.]
CGKKGYRFYPLRCSKTASVPFLSCKFFASQKTYETITAGLRACGFRLGSFASQNSGEISSAEAVLILRQRGVHVR